MKPFNVLGLLVLTGALALWAIQHPASAERPGAERHVMAGTSPR
ncbi:MAG TPA: hypothetical protein VM489_04385 [Burkholderiales bacterium]|nr:hypothetical protein [Burkholderiales bacterium]